MYFFGQNSKIKYGAQKVQKVHFLLAMQAIWHFLAKSTLLGHHGGQF